MNPAAGATIQAPYETRPPPARIDPSTTADFAIAASLVACLEVGFVIGESIIAMAADRLYPSTTRSIESR